MTDILVVSPHPDDAEIGMGPLINRWRREERHNVTIGLCTGPGDLTMAHSNSKVTYEERVNEQKKACIVLGGLELTEYRLAPASKFDTFPLSDFVRAFDQEFHRYDKVFLPLPSYNQDHRVVWEAAMSAMRPGRTTKTSFYAYEQPFGNTPVGLYGMNLGQETYRVGHGHILAAGEALLCHKSQMEGREAGGYGPAAMEAHAKVLGLQVGCDYAQNVYLLRTHVL